MPTDTVPPPPAASRLMPAKIVYGLYVLGYFLGGIPTLGGLIYAYLARGKDADLDSHLTLQIRTFWISLLVGLVGIVLFFAFGLGVLVLIALTVWNLTRVISGFVLALSEQPVRGTKYLGLVAV
ncbi:MAG: hypothetical protein DI556_13360 [Rhodovulum sulfidophilum]|uniref:DUF4870 domain-containing protein n=1 Tax=Rhodovulum sulfidophilum TaxID=35806 RepID=A0A2W5PVI7_RHOSU|nr:MAG: hypothetical protein DI556_13360 [Rhodovulum sulfidophilum]